MTPQALLATLQSFYSGFYLEDPVGNNAFSYSLRKQRRLRVAPLKAGSVQDMRLGSEPVFGEIEEGTEYAPVGLDSYLLLSDWPVPFFICDNHNQAFFFWACAHALRVFPLGQPLIHVDQHTDLRDPEQLPPFTLASPEWLTQSFDYTQRVLNVGNFLKPALQCGLFSELILMTTTEQLKQTPPKSFILDLDLDIFTPDLNHREQQERVEQIRPLLHKASLVTCATSPYFMPQEEAFNWLKRLLS